MNRLDCIYANLDRHQEPHGEVLEGWFCEHHRRRGEGCVEPEDFWACCPAVMRTRYLCLECLMQGHASRLQTHEDFPELHCPKCGYEYPDLRTWMRDKEAWQIWLEGKKKPGPGE